MTRNAETCPTQPALPPEQPTSEDTAGGARVVSVRSGRWLGRVAADAGLPSWRMLWAHDRNASLRAQRLHPFVLDEGDLVYVPARSRRGEKASTEEVHDFKLQREEARIRVRIEDACGRPVVQRAYLLRVGANTKAGNTGANGIIEQDIPIDAERIELQLEAATPGLPSFPQRAFIAPVLADEYCTIRAVWRSPLDPSYTSRVRLAARRTMLAVAELSGDGEARKSPDALREFIESQVASLNTALAVAAGIEAPAAPAGADSVSRRLKTLSAKANQRARAAASTDRVADRYVQCMETFAQQTNAEYEEALRATLASSPTKEPEASGAGSHSVTLDRTISHAEAWLHIEWKRRLGSLGAAGATQTNLIHAAISHIAAVAGQEAVRLSIPADAAAEPFLREVCAAMADHLRQLESRPQQRESVGSELAVGLDAPGAGPLQRAYRDFLQRGLTTSTSVPASGADAPEASPPASEVDLLTAATQSDRERTWEHLPERVELLIGHLTPISEHSGIVGRLENLGIDCDGVRDVSSPVGRAAVRRFQFVEGLPATGEIDGATLECLFVRHGM